MLLRFVDQKIVLAFMNLACSSLQANIQFFKHYIFCTFSSYDPPTPDYRTPPNGAGGELLRLQRSLLHGTNASK